MSAPLRLAALLLTCSLITASAAEPIPRLVRNDAAFQLLVDGKPFVILGAQVHNSSGSAGELERVWPQIRALGANTIEIPIYWDAFEPEPGRFDYSQLDAAVRGARENGLRLIPLWFATWKNGAMDYAPSWVKNDPANYPRMIGRDGRPVRVLSPLSDKSLAADRSAFEAFMRRIKQLDQDHRTVIAVQVQNEPGSLFTVRDFSPQAESAFAGPVPSELARKLGKAAGTWSEVFGPEADESFAAYYVARYLDRLAAAGKAVYPLPMTVNVWLKERKGFEAPGENYPSGGATSNMLDLWKAAAPNIDVLAPDIYVLDHNGYRAVCDAYSRPDNPLLIPETGGGGQFAKFMFYAVGEYHAIGFAPFGFNRLDGGSELDERLAPMAANYHLLRPALPTLSALHGTNRLQAAVEEEHIGNRRLDFDGWQVLAQWGPIRLSYGGEYPSGTDDGAGRVLVAQTDPNEFYVLGFDTRVNFRPARGASGTQAEFITAEEGSFVDGEWRPTRLLNGDQTFFGLRLPKQGRIVRAVLRAY